MHQMMYMDDLRSFECPHSPYLDIAPSVMNNLVDDKQSSQRFSASTVRDSFILDDPFQAHLRAVLDDESWNPNPNQTWWNKILKPFSFDARRRYDKHKAARSSKAETLITAATSPMGSMDNSLHSNCIQVQPDAKLFREPIGMHLLPRTRSRPQGQEDLCNFLNLLNLNYHDRQHSSGPLILVSDEPPIVSLPSMEFVYRPNTIADTASNTEKPSTHSLRRVNNIHDLSRQASQNSSPVDVNDSSRPVEKDLAAQNCKECAIKKMSCSPAVPFPTTKNALIHAPYVTDPVSQDDSIAMAEYMYTKATWRMYDRIMAARIKAEEAKRKSQCYHSLPPICKMGKDTDTKTVLPTFPKVDVKTTYPIGENTIDTVPTAVTIEDGDNDTSSSLLLGSSQSTCPEANDKAHHPHVDQFDHENVVFNLDLDS